MIVNLQSLSDHLDHSLEKGHFALTYPEFLVRSQIAIAERLELLLEAIKAQGHSEVSGKAIKAPESNPRVLRKKAR